jgi:hypothetical protein
MSFTENDRIFQSKSGKTFPGRDGDDAAGPGDFPAAVARALRAEFGTSPGSVKRVARLANANERAVRNWFEGKNGPSGAHLVVLMRHSDAVMEVMLRLSGRDGMLGTMVLADARSKLREALAIVEALSPG